MTGKLFECAAIEQLESRRLLTSLTFSQHEIMTTDHQRPVAAVLADLDADGDLDIVSASSGDRKIAWYENTDGQGTFAEQEIIASAHATPTSIVVSDLNGDDRLDLVVATASKDAGIVWYPQQDGGLAFRKASVISKNPPTSFVEESGEGILVAADLDGDGDNDILANSDWGDRTLWFENLDGQGTFGNEQVISHRYGRPSVSDVDRDGDLDVLVSGVIFANDDGKGDFVAQPEISSDSPSVFTAADVDGDGDPDLITNHSWFENTDGLGNFGTPRTFTDRTIGGGLPVDVDNDGDVDILAHNEFENSIWWIENTDGWGTFERGGTVTLSTKYVGSLLAGDLDGDGDADVISVSSHLYGDDTIAWFENVDSLGSFGEPKQITQSVSGAESAHAADLDGDGDLDVLSASANDGKIAWHMNLDGEGTFGEQVLIDHDFARAQEVHTVDIDEDGDLDILATFMGGTRHDADGERIFFSSSLRWYENVDGEGNFSEGELIGALPEYTSLRIRDVDGDGREDTMAFDSQGVSWYRNLPGAAGYSDRRTILNLTDTRSVGLYDAVDFDGDGDQDVVRIHWPKIVTLHENEGGRFTARHLGSEEGDRSVQSIDAADIDGDGDIDILTASVDRSSVTHCLGFECNPRDLRVSWRENTDGLGTMGEAQVLFATPTPVGRWSGTYYNDLSAVDVDRDGDLDVVMISSMDLEVTPGESVDEVVWFENLDGKGTFGTLQTVTTATNGIRSLTFADLDSDGDVDFLSASTYDNTIAWYASDLDDQDQRIPGDANGNGDVTFADFLILSANYGRQVDAVWADGDFNEDGRVSFEDFLILSATFGHTDEFSAP